MLAVDVSQDSHRPRQAKLVLVHVYEDNAGSQRIPARNPSGGLMVAIPPQLFRKLQL
jgi:hypothetical protein